MYHSRNIDENNSRRAPKCTGKRELYSLLEFLYEEEALESKLLDNIDNRERGILYILAEEIEKVFNEHEQQMSPLSLFITSPYALDLLRAIHSHGFFLSELKHWNPITHQACILITPHPLLRTPAPQP